MKFLADFLIRLCISILERFFAKKAQEAKNTKEVKEEGARAEGAAEKAVSDLTGEEFKKAPTKEPAPIKEGKNVPTTKKLSDYFKHRRNRKRL